MEKLTVNQFKPDTRFEGVLLVRRAEGRTDKNDRFYIDMNLADRTGEINCKMWPWKEEAVPRSGSAIWVRGMITEFNSRLQMKVETWEPAEKRGPVDMSLLIPVAPRSAEDMLQEIRDTVAAFGSGSLRRLTEEMLRMAGDRLSYFPAAQRIHHAEQAGLLHHTTDMLRVAKSVAEIYPFLNRDLLLAGVILHDLGKIDELASDENGNVTDYTRDGQLTGHLVRGAMNLRRAAEAAGVGGEMTALLEHMVLSHHGEPEYGSPRPPMFPEAEALHWIDMMDSRLNTMKAVMDRTPPGVFSEKAPFLDRRIYHPRYTEDAE